MKLYQFWCPIHTIRCPLLTELNKANNNLPNIDVYLAEIAAFTVHTSSYISQSRSRSK